MNYVIENIESGSRQVIEGVNPEYVDLRAFCTLPVTEEWLEEWDYCIEFKKELLRTDEGVSYEIHLSDDYRLVESPIDEESRRYLEAMKKELTKGRTVLFMDNDTVGNHYVNCPGNRVEDDLDDVMAERPCRCPFDKRTVGWCGCGCFYYCSVFNGDDGKVCHPKSDSKVITDALNKIEKLLETK